MKYAPHLGDELRAVGLGDGILWTKESVFGRESLSEVDKLKLDVVLASHDPARVPVPAEPPLGEAERKLLRKLIKQLQQQGAL